MPPTVSPEAESTWVVRGDLAESLCWTGQSVIVVPDSGWCGGLDSNARASDLYRYLSAATPPLVDEAHFTGAGVLTGGKLAVRPLYLPAGRGMIL